MVNMSRKDFCRVTVYILDCIAATSILFEKDIRLRLPSIIQNSMER